MSPVTDRQTEFPWECRDKEDAAKIRYDQPLRRKNQSLEKENQKLKELLRENGIHWSDLAKSYMTPKVSRKTRSAGRHWPMEVLLRVLSFAMQSPDPIADPLSSSNPEDLTEKEKKRGNQIAIHFLATSKAMHTEGTRMLWQSNRFLFTSPEALHHFADLSFAFRQDITHINLRIVARYYDDEKRRHKLGRNYHRDIKKDHTLKVIMRPKAHPLSRGGFRCYTWNQIVDFLAALRAPYSPERREKGSSPPRLLPNLKSLRIDLVNFSNTLLPFSGLELHDICSHEMGCTLDELQLTGFPVDDAGVKASAELSGLLKDEGLLLESSPCYLASTRGLMTLKGSDHWTAQILRAWNPEAEDLDDDMDLDSLDGAGDMHPHGGSHPRWGLLPAAPREEGHPPCTRDDDSVIWKRVPVSVRDTSRRHWMQFNRMSGYEVNGDDSEGELCSCCGEYHPGGPDGFMDLLDDQLDFDE